MNIKHLILHWSLFWGCACAAPILAQQPLPVAGGNIVDNPPFQECHASSIVAVSGGRLLATWFAGSRESNPDVAIWLSAYENGHWEGARVVADGVVDDTTRYPCWNPVLFQTKKGRLLLFYKVGPNPRSWWGMLMYSDDEGRHWSEPRRLPAGFLGPIKNKPLQLRNGDLLMPSSTESADGKTWQIHLERCDRKGRHWQKIPLDNDTFGVIQPALLRYTGRRLQLLCRSRHNRIVQTWSDDEGRTWGPLSKLEFPNPNSGLDAVSLQNGRQFLVCNPLREGRHWSDGRNKLIGAMSTDGIHWQEVYVFEDAAQGEFSYPAVIQAPDGLVHVTYTWNRKNIRHVVLLLP